MRKAYTTIIFCQIFLFGTCQPKKLAQQEIVIPMDVTTYRPIVEININGNGPYKFIFDTGSEANVIDTDLNEQLGFEIIGEDPLQTPGSKNKLVSQRVATPKVAFPGTDISKDIEMNVVNLRAMLPVDGVLSGVFLKDFLVTMDYPESKLILTKGELKSSDEGVTSFIQKPRALDFNINVAGNIIEAHVDTGSPGSFTLPYSMKDQLTFKEEPKEGHPIRTPVATFKKWDADLSGSIVVGNVIFENPRVALAEGFEFANLGYEVIKGLSTTIDRKNNLIKFEKSNSSNAIVDNEISGETNDFTGWYGGHVRKVYLDDGEMYLERGPAKLKLELLKEDLYEMTYHIPVMNELPDVRFERDSNGKVNGFTFLFEDGKEEFVKKD